MSGCCLSCVFLLNPRSGRADLAAIYHERIDVEGHHYGPSSQQRKDALKAVDIVLQHMIKWIQVSLAIGLSLHHGVPNFHERSAFLDFSLSVDPRSLQLTKGFLWA